MEEEERSVLPFEQAGNSKHDEVSAPRARAQADGIAPRLDTSSL